MHKLRAALAAITIAGAGLSVATSTTSAWTDPPENDGLAPEAGDDCGGWGNPGWPDPGSGGWNTYWITCWNPQSRNIKFRERIRLIPKDGSGNDIYIYSDWESCAGISTGKSWNANLWQYWNIVIRTAPDDLNDGC